MNQKRVTVLRELVYEGPEDWVDGTIQHSIRGTLECAPGQTITSRFLDMKTEIVEPMLRTQDKLESAMRQARGEVHGGKKK